MKKGFTLIELLIVLAIISLLAVIAYPTYNQIILKSRRAVAETDLLHAAHYLEQYRAQNDSYQGAMLPDTQNNVSFYRIEIISLTDDAYVLSAIPQNSQTKDTECGTLIYDQTGKKEISGYGNMSDCW